MIKSWHDGVGFCLAEGGGLLKKSRNRSYPKIPPQNPDEKKAGLASCLFKFRV
ncbi:hypothetical protein [Pannonibacter phragmitetus]|uniref:hypothetical protein n=1 Tax=Pannonibacter phragmitetus TaxID=121719 RepID=UPI001364C9D1|nr:hypothetical protein [Pannonibacter phragmitetus]